MGVLDTVKETVKLVQQVNDIELYKKILDLQSDIQTLFEENINLRQEVSALKEQARIKAKLLYDSRLATYYLDNGTPQPDGPFCQVCWDVDGKLVRGFQGQSGNIVCRYCATTRRRA